MNKEEFITIVTKTGYANKKQTKEWCEKNPKDDYSDKDFHKSKKCYTEFQNTNAQQYWVVIRIRYNYFFGITNFVPNSVQS